MTAADYPQHVRGVVIAAAAAKSYPPELTSSRHPCRRPCAERRAERLAALRFGFFAPGNDPTVWLTGWYPQMRASQRAAAAATQQSEWWSAGIVPLLDLQAEKDPFKPPEKRNEMKAEFGDRVTVMVIPERQPCADPGAAEGGGGRARRLDPIAAVTPRCRRRVATHRRTFTMAGCLSHVRVLDLSRVFAGPWAGADAGGFRRRRDQGRASGPWRRRAPHGHRPQGSRRAATAARPHPIWR